MVVIEATGSSDVRSLIVSLLGMLTAVVAAEPLDLRPGLWEVTYTITAPREVPTAVLESLPPEQRAAMQQAWKQRAGETRTETETSCLTAGDVAGGFALQRDSGGDCEQTVTEETSTHWQGSRRCAQDGVIRIVAIDMVAESPTRVSGTVASNVEGDSAAQAINVAYRGRWQNKDCGAAQ